MMWNYVVSALSCGSRIILYDGSPLHPTPDFQVQFLEQEGSVSPCALPDWLSFGEADC